MKEGNGRRNSWKEAFLGIIRHSHFERGAKKEAKNIRDIAKCDLETFAFFTFFLSQLFHL